MNEMRGVYVKVHETKKPVVWNVFYGNFNSREIEVFNIFDHHMFYTSCVDAAKKFKDDKEGFAREVLQDLMYFFWCKSEWEIILSHWPSKDGDREEKIDINTQVMVNAERFTDYLWENRDKLKPVR